MRNILIIWTLLQIISHLNAQQRVAPGVNPQHYQANQQYQGQHVPQHQPHQQQQQYQQQPQRVAPGVPQQQYQPPPPQQQQQYQQQQQQQQHFEQPHVQHQQQQQFQQPNVPVAPNLPTPHVEHHGGHHGGSQQILNAANIQHEKQHIAEHLDVPIDTSKMSDQELQFHYFKMHDADNNNKLDGCELIKSLIHWHEQGSKDPDHAHDHTQPRVEEKIFSDEELGALIDPILQMDDVSRDGFIDYPEFVNAQQKAQQPAQGQQPPQQH